MRERERERETPVGHILAHLGPTLVLPMSSARNPWFFKSSSLSLGWLKQLHAIKLYSELIPLCLNFWSHQITVVRGNAAWDIFLAPWFLFFLFSPCLAWHITYHNCLVNIYEYNFECILNLYYDRVTFSHQVIRISIHPKMEGELGWNVTLGLRKLEWIPRKIKCNLPSNLKYSYQILFISTSFREIAAQKVFSSEP